MLQYLQGYSQQIVQQVTQLRESNQLAAVLLKRHPSKHQLGSNKTLYQLAMGLKQHYLRQSAPLSKIIYDDKIRLNHQALGLHSYVSRQQGGKTKAKNEIRIASSLKNAPEALLTMVVVHELAHLKEKSHNKAFYQLCCHMEPEYHQLEFELRLLLILMDDNQNPYD